MRSLSVKSLNYAYPLRNTLAVDSISLQFDYGHVHFICGASGSGKTTLALLIAGLLEPQSGVIVLPQKSATDHATVAYVFQFPEHLFFADTVQEEFALLSPVPDSACVEANVAALGHSYDQLKAKFPFQLSAGTGRAVAMALQMSRNPHILIVDEPTIGLDDEHAEKVIAALREWVSHERLLVIITHDLDLIRQLSGKVHLLKEGRVGWSGSSEQLVANAAIQSEFDLA